ncbi:MAG TPA: protein-methionine-sulfoxide reductase heme-binding subunit MsrQ [Xanthobacteraceae bacterium]|jgi:sulfoxide reductase heme-binding subunit YedZ|nr:protein-methionine-sulfoxide reductase heme-binding subunit MsrQ [Xanthobacteraceae bacterium]
MTAQGIPATYQLWRDHRGRVSLLRVVTLACLLWPAVLTAWDVWWQQLGARPINDLIHRSGFWAIVFIMASLAVTPLRQVARLGALVDVRRIIGVGAFCYAAVHISLYVADQMFDLGKVASEIVLRPYLTIGFIALLGTTALAVTSTDTMVRRLGGLRWRRLHQVIYLIGVLALIHFFQQTKSDTSVPMLVAALFGWMMAYRLLAARWSRNEVPPWAAVLLTVVVAALTFAAEALWIAFKFGVSPLVVLQTAFDLDAGIRPGWIVLGAGLTAVAIGALRSLVRSAGGPRARAVRTSATRQPVRERVQG